MYFIRRFLPIFALLCITYPLRGQDDFIAFWQPGIAVNYKVVPGYKHHFSLTNRSYTFRNSDLQLRVRQLDIAHFSRLKILDNQSLGFGIQYRFRGVFEEEKGNELRLMQQYNLTWNPRATRLGHRIRTEQRIFNSKTIHRFRYRFALDRALIGEKLDVGEPYLVATLESLLSVGSGQSPQYDQRLGLNIGWLLSNSGKIQTGVEYRCEDFTSLCQDILFFNTTLVFSL